MQLLLQLLRVKMK